MKITGIDVWPVTMRLGEPYTQFYDTLDTTTSVFLRIKTNRRLVGYGCACPDSHMTGETPARAHEALQRLAEPVLRGADPLRSGWLREQLAPALADDPSALAAVDMALYDLLGKQCGLPLCRLLGGYRESILTSVTIGILPVRETVERATYWVGQGFLALKLKGGMDVECDIERVVRVRQAVGESIELRFDANQGYSVEQALAFIDRTRSAALELIEQPTFQAAPDELGAVTRKSGLRVMADESLGGSRDAFRLAANHLADMINVKLMKIGGLSPALETAAVARAAGLGVMVGSLDESALSIAAGLHFALACPAVAYADLDGHIGLVGDPAAGAVIVESGVLFPRNQPGLGFDVRE